MNGFTNAILTLLLGWLRTLLDAGWALFGSDGGGALMSLLRDHWKLVFVVLCVGGFIVDRLIYVIRWRPYYVWQARRHRRRYHDAADNLPVRQPSAQAGALPYHSYEQDEPWPEPEPAPFADDATLRYVKPLANATPAPTGRYRRQEPAAFAPVAYANQRAGELNGYAPPAQSNRTAYAPAAQALPNAYVPQAAPPTAPLGYPSAPRDGVPAFAPQTTPRASRYPQPDRELFSPQAPQRTAPRHGVPIAFSPDASFAPTATFAALKSQPPVDFEPLTAEPRYDDDPPAWNAPQSAYDDLAPLNANQNLTKGLSPAFGAIQPEPARYLQDVQAGYAPAPPPEQYYAPRSEPLNDPVHPGLDRETFQQNFGMTGSQELQSAERRPQAPVQDFTPFTVAAPQESAANKPRGLGALAQKARSFVSGEDERNPRSIHDLQTTVDMKTAFHAPVYPKKKNESEEE